MTFVGRGGERRIHVVAHPNQEVNPYRTACDAARSRRYVAGFNWSRGKVNCRECLLALVEACTFSEFLAHIGPRK